MVRIGRRRREFSFSCLCKCTGVGILMKKNYNYWPARRPQLFFVGQHYFLSASLKNISNFRKWVQQQKNIILWWPNANKRKKVVVFLHTNRPVGQDLAFYWMNATFVYFGDGKILVQNHKLCSIMWWPHRLREHAEKAKVWKQSTLGRKYPTASQTDFFRDETRWNDAEAGCQDGGGRHQYDYPYGKRR